MLYLMGWDGIGHYGEPVIFISQTVDKPSGKYFHLNNKTNWSSCDDNLNSKK